MSSLICCVSDQHSPVSAPFPLQQQIARMSSVRGSSSSLAPTSLDFGMTSIRPSEQGGPLESHGAVAACDQDLCLTDVNFSMLCGTISTFLGKQYLSEWREEPTWPLLGKVYGNNGRPVIAAPTFLSSDTSPTPICVHYIVDTSSPHNYLCDRVLRDLGSLYHDEYNPIRITINGVKTKAHLSPKDKHFPDANLLGFRFLDDMAGELRVSYGSGAIKFYKDQL